MSRSAALIDELNWRGLLHQTTGEEALLKHLEAGNRRIYSGFDPTSNSLHVGNLVPLTLLMHFQRAGFTPVALVGGGTGMIGDPSGKASERQLLTREHVDGNVQAVRAVFNDLLDTDGPNGAMVLDNHDWLAKLSYIELLRDVGKHFSVNMMIQKDSVRERLNNREQGISYTEFSYMILQSYDFLHLFREHGVSMQVGGSDQWGNIVAGTDLIRRSVAAPDNEAFALTAPLVTKADGTKFGKTESGAIWLTADKTSPYAFYQFWLNASDDDILKYLRMFSFLGREEILALEASHAESPGARTPHRALAAHMTDRIHGAETRAGVEAAASALFSGSVREIPADMLDAVFDSAPSTTHPRAALGDGISLLDLLCETLATSKSQARKLLEQGSVSVNGEKAAPDRTLSGDDLLHDRIIALRRGKKTWHVTRWA